MTTRRRFAALLPLAGAAFFADAQSAPLDPKDPQAVSLGYVPDAAQVDKSRYPKYAAGQSCASCQLFQGKPGAADGPCPIYQNKIVPAKAWCSAWVRKA